MENRYLYRYAVPPKVSYFYRVINGKETRIKLVRNSLICLLTTRNETLIFGHTIYAASRIVNKKIFNRALERIKERDRIGMIRYIWKCLTTRVR